MPCLKHQSVNVSNSPNLGLYCHLQTKSMVEMKKILPFCIVSFLFALQTLAQTRADSLRIAEIDRTYWAEMSRTVKKGDFEGYKATCHKNAVLVATVGKNKRSEPMTAALARWKQGFMDTKQGKQMDHVSFRFSQRIGGETTAHETGIFYFTSHDATGKLLSESYTHLEALLVKQGGKWVCLMEYQKSAATKAEWDALK